MIRICAWCRQEGKPGILGMSPEKPGEINEQESHGICSDHGLRLRQSFKGTVDKGRQRRFRPLALLTY